jgi:hypothetical protein
VTNTLKFTTTTIRITVKQPNGSFVTLSYTHYEKKIETISSPEISAERMRELCSL